ncbi:MAG: peptidylprolyl isomerase [Candidatus Krumholzibacteria bacterium]|nr:peptidylprolyl isomerase [Candidatus Krumholzibacteria bacterium]
MRSRALVIVLAAALVFSATGCSKKSKDGSGEGAGPGTVVVKVNGTPITMQDVQRQEEMLVQQLQNYADSAQIAGMKANIRKQSVEYAINRILLEDAIKKLDIKSDKKKIDEQMDYYRRNFVSDEAYKTDLAKRGLTVDQLRREIEVGTQAEELFSRRTANLKPLGEAEIKAFYDSNKGRFMQPERVRASHILITVDKNDTDAVRAQKRAEAKRILGDIKKGADFAEQARKYSGCPSKDKGGDLGYFERGSMVPEFENVAFTLKTGQLSDVVETKFGYHIIKVVDHEQPKETPFEQAKQNIEQYLTNQRKQQVVSGFLDSLRSASKIQYLDSSLAR